jgi:hypothetical protein
MIARRPFKELGGEDRGWLKAKHHFSFSGFDDPARMSWGAPGSGMSTKSRPTLASRRHAPAR